MKFQVIIIRIDGYRILKQSGRMNFEVNDIGLEVDYVGSSSLEWHNIMVGISDFHNIGEHLTKPKGYILPSQIMISGDVFS